MLNKGRLVLYNLYLKAKRKSTNSPEKQIIVGMENLWCLAWP